MLYRNDDLPWTLLTIEPILPCEAFAALDALLAALLAVSLAEDVTLVRPWEAFDVTFWAASLALEAAF